MNAETNWIPALDELAAALAKAQCEMHNPGFDSSNPHFKNKFASLAAVRNAVVPVLAKHGISVIQDLQTADGGISCTTILTHASGQQMRLGPLSMPASQPNAQGYGSAATYARRYHLQAVACVVGDDDDDAEGAVNRNGAQKDYGPTPAPTSNVPTEWVEKMVSNMRDLLNNEIDQPILEKDMEWASKFQDVYVAANQRLNSKEKAGWKAACERARKDSRSMQANGRLG